MRYLMRPHNESEDFDRTHNGCYNARFDSLVKVPFWRDSLENRRGILIVKKFYENVPLTNYPDYKELPPEVREKENIVVRFEPKGVEYMVIPIIWDSWEKKGSPPLDSMALITDDPAPEVKAAGHDRTPIFLKEEAVDNWLHAQGTGKEIKEKTLMEREKPYYDHKVLGVA
jgi:putative SOS response-associated peptidase YedK